MSFASRLRGVDFYRRVPIDLTEPTAPGAIISVVAGLFMTSLFIGEIMSYINPPDRTDMFVAQDSGSARLRVNVNMTYWRLPCFALSLDVLDALGRHEMGMAGGLKKTRVARLNNLGPGARPEFIGEFHENNEAQFDAQKGEGCNVAGFVLVNKVPGNFHVSSHGLQHVVMRYLGGNINVMHTIHNLWMGEVDATGDHDYEGEVHPLNGVEHFEEGLWHYEYHLDVVPTIYARRRSREERAYQLSANAHKQQVPPGHMPAAFFRYQLSPITVRFGKDSSSFLHFLTYVCAIVGGVFTVAGLLNRIVHKTAVQIQRKFLGKQN